MSLRKISSNTLKQHPAGYRGRRIPFIFKFEVMLSTYDLTVVERFRAIELYFNPVSVLYSVLCVSVLYIQIRQRVIFFK